MTDPLRREPPGPSQPLLGLAAGLAFLTRIPGLGGSLGEARASDVAAAAWSFPIVGALIGLCGGVVLLIAVSIGLPVTMAGVLAVLAGALATGALHEQGLARTTDGLSGGAGAAEKLSLMRDGRLGAPGALAILFSVLLRAAALSAFAAAGLAEALFLVISAEAVSRAAMVRVWAALPPARQDGRAFATGRPDDRATLTAVLAGAVIAFVLTLILAGFWAAAIGLAATAAVTLAVEGLLRQQIGGQTGDTLGAAQQIASVTYLVIALAFS